jgi:hypothetical protein
MQFAAPCCSDAWTSALSPQGLASSSAGLGVVIVAPDNNDPRFAVVQSMQLKGGQPPRTTGGVAKAAPPWASVCSRRVGLAVGRALPVLGLLAVLQYVMQVPYELDVEGPRRLSRTEQSSALRGLSVPDPSEVWDAVSGIEQDGGQGVGGGPPGGDEATTTDPPSSLPPRPRLAGFWHVSHSCCSCNREESST